jgi:hypothetical protein
MLKISVPVRDPQVIEKSLNMRSEFIILPKNEKT